MSMSFDDYCCLVRDASVSFVLTRRAEAAWYLHHFQGASLLIQFGSDGGASVADGIVRSDAIIVICMHKPADCRITLNGSTIGFSDIGILPPGCHFIFSAPAPRTWFAVSFPLDAHSGITKHPRQSNWHRRQPNILRNEFDLKKRLTRLVTGYKQAFGTAESESIEAQLVKTAREVFLKFENSDPAHSGHAQQSAVEQISSALKSLDPDSFGEPWRISRMARAADVSERTLHRTFNVVLGMGPARFLKLRRLNLIRRELVSGPMDRRISDILFSNGTTQGGRVAGEYRDLFGELPSETVRTRTAMTGAEGREVLRATTNRIHR